MKFFYDLACCPPTYDAISALCRAEAERRRLGAEIIEIEILPGPVGGFRSDNLWPRSVDERSRMLRNVLLPLCHLLPNVSITLHPFRPPGVHGIGIGQKLYGLPELVATYARDIRPLRPVSEVTRGPMITITLRECEHWPERNSNVPEWLEAGRRLKAMGHVVVFVRDTLRADEDLPGATVIPAASKSLYCRADLYASAALNLFVSNGPAWLSMAMDLPTMIFRPGDEKLGRAFGRRHHEASGLKWGGQMPNSPDYQRLVWQDDTADNIVNGVDSFMADNLTAQAPADVAQALA
jgi:hypothetical protein